MEHDHRGLVQIIFLSKMGDLYVPAVHLPGCRNNESYLTPPKLNSEFTPESHDGWKLEDEFPFGALPNFRGELLNFSNNHG